MNCIDKLFSKLKEEKRSALVTYICAGDPDIHTTEKLVYELEKSGADILELGIPFSDPIADGPTIQRAAQRALKHNTNLYDILELVKRVRKKTEIPIILMGYFNPIFHYGIQKFVQNAIACGVNGLIVPDLPPDEAKDLIDCSRKVDLHTIFLLAPTSTDERIKKVTNASTGYIYYVSLTGVTGARKSISMDIRPIFKKIRTYSDKPICVGFGVSNKDQVRQLVNWGADGVIVGSAIVQQIENNLGNPGLVKKVGKFVTELSKGIK